MTVGHVTKSSGHSQRISVNAVGGQDVVVDFNAVPTSGDLIVIQPWSQLELHPIGIAVRMAWQAGEISAGRYFTLPAEIIRTIVGPGMATKIYLRGDSIAGIIEVEVFE